MKRHTVQIINHNPAWLVLAADECKLLRDTLPDLAYNVQHVGSTAVPNLPAKPIIDIAIAVKSFNHFHEIVKRLTQINYIYRGDCQGNGGQLFVKESQPDVRTVHLHIVELNDVQWQNYLTLREILQHDSDIRRKYARLKRDIAKKNANDRKEYTAAKDKFIKSILNIN